MRGLQRKVSLSNLLFPLRLLVSVIQCLLYFLSFRPLIIIGTGGYVSGPALIAGLIMKIPTIIQEQNSYPGLVNRWLGKHVDQVHITYEDSRKYFRQQAQVFTSGNPVRIGKADVSKSEARTLFNLKPDCITILLFGGSQGAHALNRVLLDSLEKLLAIGDLQILWATGERDNALVKENVQDHEDRISVHAFISDMMLAYRAADLAICRSGASTLSELTITAVPAILVPYPHSTAGHQEANARSMEQHKAAIVVREDEMR